MPAVDLSDIQRVLERHQPRRVQGHARAAVAAILRDRRGPLELLFVQRSQRKGDRWSGHWAFPGGIRRAGDASLSATAVRETREEIGVDLESKGRLLGSLSDLVTLRHRGLGLLVVTPFVYASSEEVELQLGPEIHACQWVSLSTLAAARGSRGRLRRALGWISPRHGYELGPRPLWGLTLRMVDELVDCSESA